MVMFYSMKKLFTILFIFLSTFSFIFAQTTADEVCKSLTANKVTTGTFVQVKKAKNLKRPLKSSGTYIFSQNGIAWQNQKPFKSSTIITKEYMIQIAPDGKKTVIDGSSNETFKSASATLSSLFSGSKSDLEKVFTIKSFSSDAASWKMILNPKDKTIAQSLKEITLSGKVSSKETSLDFLEVIQNETTSTTYTLSNQTYKQELSIDEKNLFAK